MPRIQPRTLDQLPADTQAQTPNAVTDGAFTEFASHYDEEEQIEIVAVIALFGFLNRWNSTVATDIEASPLEALQKLSHTSGAAQ
jgi:alkylhydroperoxidase family enzyme